MKMLYLSGKEILLSLFYSCRKEACFSSSCSFLAVAFIFMTSYGSHVLVIAKKYAFTVILAYSPAEQPRVGCAVPSCLPPPSLHASHVGSCQVPACWARRLPAPRPSLHCSGTQDTTQPACFTSPSKKDICCPANPSNISEAATACCGLLVSAPGPLFSPFCETKGERVAKAVKCVTI